MTDDRMHDRTPLGSPGYTWVPVRPDNPRYVKNAMPACVREGCRGPELAGLLQDATASGRRLVQELEKNIQGEKRRMQPTRSLWCEQRGHSFSEKDPELQVLSITGRDKEGNEVTESRTICGPCAKETKMNLGAARNNGGEIEDGDDA